MALPPGRQPAADLRQAGGQVAQAVAAVGEVRVDRVHAVVGHVQPDRTVLDGQLDVAVLRLAVPQHVGDALAQHDRHHLVEAAGEGDVGDADAGLDLGGGQGGGGVGPLLGQRHLAVAAGHGLGADRGLAYDVEGVPHLLECAGAGGGQQPVRQLVPEGDRGQVVPHEVVQVAGDPQAFLHDGHADEVGTGVVQLGGDRRQGADGVQHEAGQQREVHGVDQVERLPRLALQQRRDQHRGAHGGIEHPPNAALDHHQCRAGEEAGGGAELRPHPGGGRERGDGLQREREEADPGRPAERALAVVRELQGHDDGETAEKGEQARAAQAARHHGDHRVGGIADGDGGGDGPRHPPCTRLQGPEPLSLMTQ
ncbi:hypothetical protein GCM10020001_043680 [Nonomuraea salmonea]